MHCLDPLRHAIECVLTELGRVVVVLLSNYFGQAASRYKLKNHDEGGLELENVKEADYVGTRDFLQRNSFVVKALQKVFIRFGAILLLKI